MLRFHGRGGKVSAVRFGARPTVGVWYVLAVAGLSLAIMGVYLLPQLASEASLGEDSPGVPNASDPAPHHRAQVSEDAGAGPRSVEQDGTLVRDLESNRWIDDPELVARVTELYPEALASERMAMALRAAEDRSGYDWLAEVLSRAEADGTGLLGSFVDPGAFAGAPDTYVASWIGNIISRELRNWKEFGANPFEDPHIGTEKLRFFVLDQIDRNPLELPPEYLLLHFGGSMAAEWDDALIAEVDQVWRDVVWRVAPIQAELAVHLSALGGAAERAGIPRQDVRMTDAPIVSEEYRRLEEQRRMELDAYLARVRTAVGAWMQRQ